MKPLCAAPLCAAVLLLLNACALLPVEEELPEAPVLHSYEAPVYQMTAVARGDLQLQRIVPCTYMPAKKAGLSFSIGGELVEAVYVHQGDLVKKGQLLAELFKGDLEIRIAEEKNSLELLRLQILHTKENWLYTEKRGELEIERLEEVPWLPITSYEKQVSALRQDLAEEKSAYENELMGLEDSVRLQEQAIAELQGQLNRRQVTAPFNGAVTYVRKLGEGAKSRAGERLLTVADTDTSVFVVSREEDLPYFTEGAHLEVSCHKELYPAEVASGASLGLSGDEAAAIYLRLTTPELTLEDGDSGSVTLLLEERRDVLYLPSKAVSGSDDGKLVYYLDENGLRAAKEVSVGLDTGSYVEILSGLAEGDSVILN